MLTGIVKREIFLISPAPGPHTQHVVSQQQEVPNPPIEHIKRQNGWICLDLFWHQAQGPVPHTPLPHTPLPHTPVPQTYVVRTPDRRRCIQQCPQHLPVGLVRLLATPRIHTPPAPISYEYNIRSTSKYLVCVCLFCYSISSKSSCPVAVLPTITDVPTSK